MLTFFRRIRKGLLKSSQIRKYILYAIGEIALVVIGILIALQINNWNEWRKDRVKEAEILEDLHENLTLNSRLLEGYLEVYNEFNRSSEIILSVLDNKLPYSDTLQVHFHQARMFNMKGFLPKSGFESLKNAGFDLLTSESLKKELLNLFENIYPSMQDFVSRFTTNPYWTTYIAETFYFNDSKEGPGLLKPKDYTRILEDDYFYHQIKYFLGTREHLEGIQEDCLRETQRVLQLIEDEL